MRFPFSNQSTPTSVRRGWAMGALVAAATASVVLSMNAWAMSGADAHCRWHGQGGAHEGMGPDHMGHAMMGTPFASKRIDRLLDKVKATQAQRTQIHQIADKAQADLDALHAQVSNGTGGTQSGQAMLGLLTQPTIDAAAAEKARQTMVAHHDAVSKCILQGTLDMANVLTPEQRTILGDEMKLRMAHHHAHGQQPVAN